MSNIFALLRAPENKGKTVISYSQYNMYANCPLRWKLSYIDKLSEYRPSIDTVFGTALHETLQAWLNVLYTTSVKASNQMNLHNLLKENMVKAYTSELEKTKNKHFCTQKQLTEYYEDGIQILDFIQRKRTAYFSTKHMRLVGVEFPLSVPVSDMNPNVVLVGFVDVVFYDESTDEIDVIDIKTSRNGWKDKDKKDKTKTAQLIIYKEYLAKQWGIPADKINVEYFIVRRKVFTEGAYPQKRVQTFKPTSGKRTRKLLVEDINRFVETAFLPDGSRNPNAEYPAVAGENADHCKYCDFKQRYDLCPLEKRLKHL